jgi:hypothetical protein
MSQCAEKLPVDSEVIFHVGTTILIPIEPRYSMGIGFAEGRIVLGYDDLVNELPKIFLYASRWELTW